MPEIPDEIQEMPPRTSPLEVGRDINGEMPGTTVYVPSGVLGIDTREDFMETYDVNTVIQYLGNLDFDTHIPEYYDCEDRAFWGVAHARYRFPGLPIGVVSGHTSQNHPIPNQDHAVIVMWQSVGRDNQGKAILKPILYDPLPNLPTGYNRLVDNFATVKSVIGFPVGDNIPPIEGRELVPLNNTAIVFDIKRIIYPLHTDDEMGIMDYLKNEVYNEECIDREFHTHAVGDTTFEDKWIDCDKALWAFAHVRRAYAGCTVGVAIGREVLGIPIAALIIWYKEDGEIKHKFWDPNSPEEDITFTPLKIFA